MDSTPLSSGPTYHSITYTVIKAHCRNAFNTAIGGPNVYRQTCLEAKPAYSTFQNIPFSLLYGFLFAFPVFCTVLFSWE